MYGSYLKNDVDVVSSAKNVVLFSTLAAVLSAMVVIPAVFALGVDPLSGPPLLFITLPQVFADMPFGGLFCFLFFLAVACAALTSLVNLFEPPIEALQSQLNMPRWAAVLVVFVVALGVACLSKRQRRGGRGWISFRFTRFRWARCVRRLCSSGCARRVSQRLKHSSVAKRPLGAWFEPMARYVFVGLTALVIVLGIALGGIG